jgi:ketosteroid isomerase-like protein
MTEVDEPSAAVRAELIDVERRRCDALVAVDVDALAGLLDDELVHIHAPGVTHSKAQLLEHLATRRPYLNTERGELAIRMVGDVAIMTGPLTNRLRNPDGSERTLSGVATQVLRRDAHGAWRFVSFQMTPTGEQVWGSLPSENDAHGGVDNGAGHGAPA